MIHSPPKYKPEALTQLAGIELISSQYTPDNLIVLRAPKPTQRPTPESPQTFASFYLTVWDIEKGEASGNCPIDQATEWHVSPKRYAEITAAIQKGSQA